MTIDVLAHHLYQVTEQMLNLSVETDSFVEDFELLQAKQTEIRQQIQLYKERNEVVRWPKEILVIFERCKNMEMAILDKLSYQKEEAAFMMRKVGNAKKMRHLYDKDSPMRFGAFIDKSK